MDIKNSERLFSYLQTLHKKYTSITEQLSDPEVINNQTNYRKLTQEISRLKPLENHHQKLTKLALQKEESQELLQNSKDEELIELATEELADINSQIENLIENIQILLVSDEQDDNRNVFLEIRSGVGGNEASLFASDLLRMYTRISERKVWKAEVISTTYSSIGGIKEIILYIAGTQTNKYLRFESGVHRVQRVPVTESSGRIHTSTVTIAVMPEVDDVEVEINLKDIRIDTFSSSAPGGQHVNRTQSAIRITHFPSGIVVSCQDEKSQHKNKDKAMKVLKARIFEHEQEKQDSNIANSRKSQIGSGDRSEKIRTYNFPQNRVTDHRITGRNFNIEGILDGNTDDLITILQEQHLKQSIVTKLKEIIA